MARLATIVHSSLRWDSEKTVYIYIHNKRPFNQKEAMKYVLKAMPLKGFYSNTHLALDFDGDILTVSSSRSLTGNTVPCHVNYAT